MIDIVYKCLNEKCNLIFHGANKDGVCCPVCRQPIIPIREFKDYYFKDIPSYKHLKEAMLGEQMVIQKEIQEFRESGMLWFINNLLHIFGWAVVIEMKDDKAIRMYPARVKFRGFSEDNNTEGYIKVSEYMKENAAELLEEANS